MNRAIPGVLRHLGPLCVITSAAASAASASSPGPREGLRPIPPLTCPVDGFSGGVPVISSRTVGWTMAAQIGDLDGDEIQEVVAPGGSLDGPSFMIFRVSGSRAGVPEVVPVDGQINDLQLHDLDDDGDLDVLIHDAAGGRLSATFNLGSAGWAPGWTVPMNGWQADILTRPDGTRVVLVPRNTDGPGCWAYDLLPGGELGPQTIELPDPVTRARHVVAVDVTGDGLEDLLIGRLRTELFPGQADGTWGPKVILEVAPSERSRLTPADVDADGVSELLYASEWAIGDPPRIRIFGRDASGALVTRLSLSGRSPGRAGRVATGDFDGDGHLDFAVIVEGPESMLDAIDRYRGDGRGQFEFLDTLPAAGGRCLATGDVNADGRADIYTAPSTGWGSGASTRSGWILFGTASSTGPGSRLLPLAGRRMLAAWSAGPDDRGFLAVEVPATGGVEIHAWTGTDGTDGTEVIWRSNVDAPPLHALFVGGPAPGGGRRILHCVGDDSEVIVRVLRTGGPVVTLEEVFLVDPETVALLEGDVDGDGDLDLVIQRSGGATDLRRRSRGGLDAAQPIGDWVQPSLADLDRDGRSDLFGLDMSDDAAGPPRLLQISWGDERAGLARPVVQPTPDVSLIDVHALDAGPATPIEIVGAGVGLVRFIQVAPRTFVGTEYPLPPGLPSILFDLQVIDAGTDSVGLLNRSLSSEAEGLAIIHVQDAEPGRVVPTSAVEHWVPAAFRFHVVDLDGDGRDDLVATGSDPEGQGLVTLDRRCRLGCLGDLDADGEVGFRDLITMIAPVPPAFESAWALWDLDGDHCIDGADIAVLLGNWGPCAVRDASDSSAASSAASTEFESLPTSGTRAVRPRRPAGHRRHAPRTPPEARP